MIVSKIELGELDKLLSELDGRVDMVVSSAALRVEGQAKINASGRPGPNVDTGAFRAGIISEKEGPGLYLVHDSVEYGIYLELGTSKAPAYPSFVPAVERLREDIEKSFRALFE